MGLNIQGPNLKKMLIAEMDKTGTQNGLGDLGRCVSSRTLQDIFSTKNLRPHLKLVFGYWPVIHEVELDRLVSLIQNNGNKLHAILILLDRPQMVRELLLSSTHEVNDRVLFGMDEQGYHEICSEDKLKSIPQLIDIAEEFYIMQWHFPPMLYSEQGIQFFDLQHFKMPFTSKPSDLGKGSYGSVYATEIDEEYLRPSQGAKGLKIVYKQVLIGMVSDDKRQRIFNEVKVLQARPHPNVMQLLGSFVAGLEQRHPEGQPEECLYMISQRAQMDMNQWLRAGVPGYDAEQLRKHIYSGAMLGLASGVSWIHREIDGKVGYHRDLKPGNILLFEIGRNEWLWKIADFGCANLKSVENTATNNPTATLYWAPPEFLNNVEGRTHGRSHDVYSLGCIFLLLATITVHGWTSSEVEEFKKRREQAVIDLPENQKYQITEGAFYQCKPVVDEWIEYLKNSRQGDEIIKPVLKIIQHMQKPYNERITAWEVVTYLYNFTEQWKLDPACPKTDYATFRDDKVVEMLGETIQPSRKIDMSIKITPYTRAIDWGMSENFLKTLKANRWSGSQPQTTSELKERGPTHDRLRSTLPPDNSQHKPIFGYQNIFDEVSRAFGYTNIVALCGLGGIGKTRIALSYATQFTNEDADLYDKKHTFWVQLTDKKTMRNGYESMVKEMRDADYDVKSFDDASLVTFITDWLQNANNGQWILVVDDIHVRPEQSRGPGLLDLKALQKHGQILITTRDRGIALNLLGGHRKGGYVKMNYPSMTDRLRIYDQYINHSLFPSVTDETRDLMEHFTLPKVIIEAVLRMNYYQSPPDTLLKDFKEKGFRVVESFSKDILEYLLRHVLKRLDPEGQPRLDPEAKQWPPEIERLFILAMFEPEGADLDLLAIELKDEEHDELRMLHGVLKNSHLIFSSNSDPNDKKYHVDPTVQAAVWAWIKEKEGRDGLSKRFNKMLHMLYAYYQKRARAKPEDGVRLKKELLPHFNRFVNFVDEEPQDSQNAIEYSPRAIQAIVEFSRLLSDRDQYEEATKVLNFAHKHYQISESRERGPEDDESKHQLNVRYRLEQQRMKTYLIDPIYRMNNAHRDGARAIVDEQIEEVRRWAKNPRSKQLHDQFWMSMRKEELELDLFRVHCYLESWEDAEKQLKSMNAVSITVHRNNGNEVPVMQVKEGINWKLNGNMVEHVRLNDERERFLKMLGIRKKWEEGQYYFLKGRQAKMDESTATSVRWWELAREALHFAKVALTHWPVEQEMLYEVMIHIAEVDTKLGTNEGLDNAAQILEDARTRIQGIHGSDCKRAWDVECKINAVKLRRKSDLNTAIHSLEALLGRYETRFSKQAKVTVNCAFQLQEAYVACNRWDEVDKLSERMPTMTKIDRRSGDWWAVTWEGPSQRGAVIVACGIVSVVVWFAVRNRQWNPTRLWVSLGTGTAAAVRAVSRR